MRDHDLLNEIEDNEDGENNHEGKRISRMAGLDGEEQIDLSNSVFHDFKRFTQSCLATCIKNDFRFCNLNKFIEDPDDLDETVTII